MGMCRGRVWKYGGSGKREEYNDYGEHKENYEYKEYKENYEYKEKSSYSLQSLFSLYSLISLHSSLSLVSCSHPIGALTQKLWYNNSVKQKPLTVAYFSMEIGLDASMPTYAGGLGMLAADLMRSAADKGVAAACVTICWQHGYMRQHIRADGTQSYENVDWNPSDHLHKLEPVVSVTIEGKEVKVGVWEYRIDSAEHSVPVYFLDTNIEGNTPEDCAITEHLYGGDGVMRLKQEVVLGIAGVRMLRALGYEDVRTYHMNEGHAAFLTLELLKEREYKNENVRSSCAFTTHTPVAAGHDVFPYDMAQRVVGDMLPWHIRDLAGQDALNMTLLAMHLSRYTCGVSRIHGAISRRMFPGESIDYITNGIHPATWACPEMQHLFDRVMPGWREHPLLLEQKCRDLPPEELWHAHQEAKSRLIAYVNQHTDRPFSQDVLTIATARRVVPYKRPELLYTNLDRLREVCGGRVQIIHAGNAHPNDPFSQEVIQRIVERAKELKDSVNVVYLENYNPTLAKMLVSGTDVWLNTPTRQHEASGTSGMKACLNGVLNLSSLDGWWIEAFDIDPEAGWRIGPLAEALGPEEYRKIDAEDLYTQLQYEVIHEYYYKERKRWIRCMMRAIGLIGRFNTHRCIDEYLEKAWKR